jgi:histidinol-phosphate aminotransferase
MSKYASKKINDILPYTPGEQPQDKKYIKLNTNENPYFTAMSAVDSVTQDLLKNLRKYSDPECKPLVSAIAHYYDVKESNILVTNGSDEALAFCFQAYGKGGVCFADVTYGFYSVFANLYDCPTEIINLTENFTIVPEKYYNKHKTVVIANPNAQTGIALNMASLENIIKNNQENIVIIDQAYVDFGEGNAIPLIKTYKNLVVVNTFSKSRSLAGARVGYIIADENLIEDLKKVKYSFHPYNVNSVSMSLATKAIGDKFYFDETVKKIIKSREYLTGGLTKLGFTVLPSSANFVLAKTDKINGKELYLKLKDNGILVRHFDEKRISDFVRITVGTDEEIKILLDTIKKILEEIS